MHQEKLYIKHRVKRVGRSCFSVKNRLYNIDENEVLKLDIGTRREDLIRPMSVLKLDYATEEEYNTYKKSIADVEKETNLKIDKLKQSKGKPPKPVKTEEEKIEEVRNELPEEPVVSLENSIL